MLLCSSLVLFLRSKSKQIDNKDTQKIFLDYENDDFTLIRTALMSHLSTQFIEFIKASKPIVEGDILTEALLKTKPEQRFEKKYLLRKKKSI